MFLSIWSFNAPKTNKISQQPKTTLQVSSWYSSHIFDRVLYGTHQSFNLEYVWYFTIWQKPPLNSHYCSYWHPFYELFLFLILLILWRCFIFHRIPSHRLYPSDIAFFYGGSLIFNSLYIASGSGNIQEQYRLIVGFFYAFRISIGENIFLFIISFVYIMISLLLNISTNGIILPKIFDGQF